MRLLVKVPVPVPLDVLLPDMVGLGAIPQQTPLAVMLPPPSSVMLPPVVAEVEVTEETSVVVSTAPVTWSVTKESSSP